MLRCSSFIYNKQTSLLTPCLALFQAQQCGLINGERPLGRSDDDIHQATITARVMVARWGMPEEVGPVDLRDSKEHSFLGREIAQPRHHCEYSTETVDHAVQHLLLDAEKCATETVEKHQSELKRLVAALEEHETLQAEDIKKCLGPGCENKHLISVTR